VYAHDHWFESWDRTTQLTISGGVWQVCVHFLVSLNAMLPTTRISNPKEQSTVRCFSIVVGIQYDIGNVTTQIPGKNEV
jgi:hypothetical protein